MTINQQSFPVSNMCDEFMVCGCMQVSSDNVLNRAVCSEESRVMFIEGVPTTALWDSLCCEAIKKEKPNKVQCDGDEIEIYLQQASPFSVSVLPIRCKSGWNLPPKSHCVFLALCVVRTLLFAGWQLEQAG